MIRGEPNGLTLVGISTLRVAVEEVTALVPSDEREVERLAMVSPSVYITSTDIRG